MFRFATYFSFRRSFVRPTEVPVQEGASLAGKLSFEASYTRSCTVAADSL